MSSFDLVIEISVGAATFDPTSLRSYRKVTIVSVSRTGPAKFLTKSGFGEITWIKKLDFSCDNIGNLTKQVLHIFTRD